MSDERAVDAPSYSDKRAVDPPADTAAAATEAPPASPFHGPGAPQEPASTVGQRDAVAPAVPRPPASRGVRWWIGWLLAIPSAALLLAGPIAALTRPNPDPYVVGLAFGRLGVPLLIGFALRGVYKAASRARPRPHLLSPWVLVVAAVVFLLLALGRIADQTATRARAESLRSIPPAQYLELERPYESVRLPASEESAVRERVANTLSGARASELEVRIVRQAGQDIGVALAFRVEATTAADEDFWPGVLTGLEQGAGKGNVERATLEGRSAAVARMTDQTLVMWQDGTVVAGVIAPERNTAEAVARAVIRGNAESSPS